MDTQHTAPIPTFCEIIKILHLESTNLCKENCPIYLRETETFFLTKDIQNNNSSNRHCKGEISFV